MRFLSNMKPTWNISLFHYRNQGADYGRVLVGIQLSDEDSMQFQKSMLDLGYFFAEETSNPVYRLFLN